MFGALLIIWKECLKIPVWPKQRDTWRINHSMTTPSSLPKKGTFPWKVKSFYHLYGSVNILQSDRKCDSYDWNASVKKGGKNLLIGVKNFFIPKYTSWAFFWIKNQCASMKIRSHGKFSILKKFSNLIRRVHFCNFQVRQKDVSFKTST